VPEIFRKIEDFFVQLSAHRRPPANNSSKKKKKRSYYGLVVKRERFS